MDTAQWNAELDTAFSERDVLGTVRLFLAEWNPEELGALPRDCRPGELNQADDVAAFAYTLAAAQCARVGSETNDVQLTRMCDFFAHACHRLALIAANRAARGVSFAFHHLVSRP
jgi:hypothetical protein